MMQIKFQCYRPFGAREEDVLRLLCRVAAVKRLPVHQP